MWKYFFVFQTRQEEKRSEEYRKLYKFNKKWGKGIIQRETKIKW